MYQAINDEMIDFFAGLVGLQSYASTIGEPVNKYRHSYKKLDFIKRIFLRKFLTFLIMKNIWSSTTGLMML